MADEDWCSLLDHAQSLFQAIFILFKLARLLYHRLDVCHTFTPSETLLSKIIVAGQKKSMEATCQQIWDFSMEYPPLPPQYK